MKVLELIRGVLVSTLASLGVDCSSMDGEIWAAKGIDQLWCPATRGADVPTAEKSLKGSGWGRERRVQRGQQT